MVQIIGVLISTFFIMCIIYRNVKKAKSDILDEMFKNKDISDEAYKKYKFKE